MASETDVAALVKSISPAGVDFSDKKQALKYALKLACSAEDVFTHLKGEQKADLVLRAVRECVQMSSLAQDSKDEVISWINVVVPHALTAAVSVSKGEVPLHHAAAGCCVALLHAFV